MLGPVVNFVLVHYRFEFSYLICCSLNCLVELERKRTHESPHLVADAHATSPSPLLCSRTAGHRASGRARSRSSYDDVVCHPVSCVRSWGQPGPIHRAQAQEGPQGPMGAHKGPARKGLAHKVPGGPPRAWPTRAQRGPQGPRTQGPRGANTGPAHNGTGDRGIVAGPQGHQSQRHNTNWSP